MATSTAVSDEDNAVAAAASNVVVIENEVVEDNEDENEVMQDLRRFLLLSPSSSNNKEEDNESSLFDKSATAVPVAAIKALLGVVQRSHSNTMMGLQDELQRAAHCMTQNYHKLIVGGDGGGGGVGAQKEEQQQSHQQHQRMRMISSSNIALQSGIELFLKYVTRTFLESPNFEECRQSVLERGARFQSMSLAARDRIAAHSASFVPLNGTVLTHGWSRVVAAILLEASKNNKHFDLILLEGRPDASGVQAAQFYAKETNIPVTVVADAAMGYIMERVDMVLIGAEGVLENGVRVIVCYVVVLCCLHIMVVPTSHISHLTTPLYSLDHSMQGIVNKLGTYALAACAENAGKPLYVAAESYKFARLYPLHQSDLPNHHPAPLHFVDTTTAATAVKSTKGDDEDDDDNKQPEQLTFQSIAMDPSIKVVNPPVDFTPAKFITLLFTDLGVLTPSAVSDELIRLYQ